MQTSREEPNYTADALDYAIDDPHDDEPCPPVTATTTFSLCGIDFGKVDEEEREFRRFADEERREQAIAWLRQQKRIYLDQRRLPFANFRFSSYKRTRARRRVR